MKDNILSHVCVSLDHFSSVAASKDEYLSIVQVTEDFIPVLEPDDLFFDARIYRASKEVGDIWVYIVGLDKTHLSTLNTYILL